MKHLFLMCLFLSFSSYSFSQDEIELETAIIKGNTELPKILYVVPWQDVTDKPEQQQKLTLHSLFGDFFEPVTPEAPETASR